MAQGGISAIIYIKYDKHYYTHGVEGGRNDTEEQLWIFLITSWKDLHTGSLDWNMLKSRRSFQSLSKEKKKPLILLLHSSFSL